SYFAADSLFAPAPGSYMDLAVSMPNSDVFTGLLVPDLRVLSLETLKAHYHGDQDELTVDLVLPEVAYQNARVEGLEVHVDAVGNRLNSSLVVQRASQDSLFIEGLSLASTSTNGGLRNTLRVQRPEEAPTYELAVVLTRDIGGNAIHVLPDGLVLNGTPWTADPLNKVRFLTSGPESEHFDLRGDGQHISMVTAGEGTQLTFDQFQLGTLLNIVRTNDSTAIAEGELTGEVAFPGSSGAGLKADLGITQLKAMGHLLGDLRINATEPRPDHYLAAVELANGPNELDADVDADVSGARPVLDASVKVAFTDVGFLQPFVQTFLYELGGGLAGDVRFRMSEGTPALDGDLRFRDARMGVSATGSLFRLRDEAVHFDRHGIHLDRFTLRDSLDNAFTLDGDIHTTDLRDMRFDLSLRTDAFQLTRKRVGGNDLFHGDVFTRLDLTVTGTSELPVLKGDIGVLENTDLSIILPGSRVSLVSSEGVVIFKDSLQVDTLAVTDGQLLRDSLESRLKGIDLDLAIRVDKRASFTVVLDPTTGDAASFKGEGDLRFRYNAQGEMYLSGPFTLAEGGYTLEFYGLVKKRFELVEGSTVVWDGDPLAAVLGIKARYRSESAAYPLVASTGSYSQAEQNRLQQRLPFDVIISVDGDLTKPDIDFAIDLERSYRNSYPQVSSRLDQLAGSSGREERTKQVFGLLVLNSFIQDEGSGGAPSSGIATTAARNSVNGILTDQMNKLTGRYIKGVDISLGVNTVDQAAGDATYQRTSVDYKVSKSFLDERLSFEVGGSVGVDEQEDRVGNVSSTRAAQYVVYYDLTRDGRYRLRGFYENAFDLYDGNITDSGVAIMYTRDFEENEVARTAAREAETKRRQEEAERLRKSRDAGNGKPVKP
ncbi:MAG: translocation/assembly module TamB, partial [Flavobacteriales bacterium]|nr:translocation/assembly module TamB [Flavobacteriales bacterium]